MNHYRPNVPGLQEALNFQISEIRTMLPGYEKVDIGNSGGSKMLHNAIFLMHHAFSSLSRAPSGFQIHPIYRGQKDGETSCREHVPGHA
ncbi:hypothetical protein ER57_16555 [Smithella sp. SCADC]|nr:hypothetical protein ER57_16555 [Smithella sp. SCADC]